MYREKGAAANATAPLKTNPNFNTNAPPFEVRGCKVILVDAFSGQGVQIGFRGVRLLKIQMIIAICLIVYIFLRSEGNHGFSIC